MIFDVKSKKDALIERHYEKSMKEFEKFFEMDLGRNKPKLFFVEDRKTIDVLRGFKTPSWNTGWFDGKHIYMLDVKNFEKESSHKYHKEKYLATIKHEISHAFYNKIASYKREPIWLSEGLAIYLSGQNKFKKKPAKFENFLRYYDKTEEIMYYESGFAVQVLVEKSGKNKILELIKLSKDCKNEEDFSKTFKKVYGFSLEYKNFKIG